MSSPYPPQPGEPIPPWQQPPAPPSYETSPFPNQPAQPAYGQQYEQPGYGAPESPYGQPAGYGQPPGYGQQNPAYPGAGFPPPPQRKSRKGLVITLVTVAAVLVLGCSIGGVALWSKVNGTANQDANTTLTLPDHAGGLTKSTDSSTADALDSSMSGGGTFKDAVSASYTDSAGPTKPVIVWGAKVAKSSLSGLDSQLDLFFTGMAGEAGSSVTGKTDVTPPSSVGGSMKCALYSNTTGGTAYHFGVCAWANHAALVAVMGLSRSTDETSTLAGKMLPDIVHKS